MEDNIALKNGSMLSDRHMHAAHKLLMRQHPELQGLQSTLLPQAGGFTAVSEEGGYCAHGMHNIMCVCV